ncbi:alpha-N-acetylgalactosaminide alpha-2,6-sialyltransferase 3-like, partial [Coregonus clupeaformis]|uniref:alpha-N-acetylgalactosaminide alpha-2,6-sialyltransferase 3-like n=1 Tax=Coregonus clupeaformis TaxID=59861 RepID=UPI001E1C5353
KKSVIATSLIAVVSLFVGVVNYLEKPYFLMEPVFSRQPHKAFKPHLGYVSIPKQESPDVGHDVGRHTTLRVVSHTSVPLLLQRSQYFFGQANDTVYVVWGPLRNMRKDGKGIVYNMLRQAIENYPQARIYLTTEERMKYCDMVFKKETGKDRIQSGSYLSTGWFTLILTMDMCKEIHVYGMINHTYCRSEGYRKVPYHYYEAGSRDECAEYLLHESAPYGGHRFITEKAVFAKWSKTHAIKFYNPPWQPS